MTSFIIIIEVEISNKEELYSPLYSNYSLSSTFCPPSLWRKFFNYGLTAHKQYLDDGVSDNHSIQYWCQSCWASCGFFEVLCLCATNRLRRDSGLVWGRNLLQMLKRPCLGMPKRVPLHPSMWGSGWISARTPLEEVPALSSHGSRQGVLHHANIWLLQSVHQANV